MVLSLNWFLFSWFSPRALGCGRGPWRWLILTSIKLFTLWIFTKKFDLQSFAPPTSCCIALCLSDHEEKQLLFCPLPTNLPQTYYPTVLQFCNTSTTLIILGFIHIISKPHNSPRFLNTTVAVFLIRYSTFGLNKTNGNFFVTCQCCSPEQCSPHNACLFQSIQALPASPKKSRKNSPNIFSS